MRAIILASTIGMLAAGNSWAAPPATALPSFHIQAHRGGGIAMPENTLETFQWAWKRGVTPEADLRTTKDGAIVCFHDANVKRVVRNAPEKESGTPIEKLPLADLQQFDVGAFRGREFAGERVPTLESVFAEMRGRPERLLYIDVKTAELGALAKLVKQSGVESQVIFTTPDHALIREWKKRVPESMTLLWNGGSEEELAKKMDALRKADFEGITHLQVHVQVGDLSSDEPFKPSRRFIKSLGDELAERGIVFQVLPWECDDPLAYEKLLALGVDSFATDYPDVTIAAVRRHQSKQPRQASQ